MCKEKCEIICKSYVLNQRTSFFYIFGSENWSRRKETGGLSLPPMQNLRYVQLISLLISCLDVILWRMCRLFVYRLTNWHLSSVGKQRRNHSNSIQQTWAWFVIAIITLYIEALKSHGLGVNFAIPGRTLFQIKAKLPRHIGTGVVAMCGAGGRAASKGLYRAGNMKHSSQEGHKLSKWVRLPSQRPADKVKNCEFPT